MRCPLTGIAAQYNNDRRDNFDIFLPEWLARHNKVIFGALYVVGIAVTIACAEPRLRRAEVRLVQRPIVHRLGRMRAFDPFRTRQVGDRSRNLENAIVGPG